MTDQVVLMVACIAVVGWWLALFASIIIPWVRWVRWRMEEGENPITLFGMLTGRRE